MFNSKVLNIGIVFVIFPNLIYTEIPVNAGLCASKFHSCSCGGEYEFHIEIKQCSRFHKWKLKCGDCKNEFPAEQRCRRYEHCRQCNPHLNYCVQCKPDRYGQWCTGICDKCYNGVCDKDTGRCICDRGYKGLQCEKLDGCPPPPLIANGYPVSQSQNGICSHGSSAVYHCHAGHIMQGNPVVLCKSDGYWSEPIPTCSRICSPLSVPLNGNIVHDSSFTMAKYSCNTGFELNGDAERICGSNSTWSGQEPKCVKIIVCPGLVSPEFGLVEIKGGNASYPSPGTLAKYTCNSDYVVMGPEISQCRENGTWSSPPAQCVYQEYTCPHPGELANGKITVNGLRGRSLFAQMTTIHFTCDSLHYLVGNSSITCEENATWSGKLPKCVKITTCVLSDNFPNGAMDVYVPDPVSTSTFRTYPATSNVTSRFASFRPRFRIPVTSRPPQARLASLGVKLPRGHYHEGTRISFSCESSYYDLVGSKSRSCQSNGEWSGRPSTCVPICGRSGVPLTPKIVDGTPSKEGQWPWQVGISRRLADDDPLGKWFIVCGGSLITEEWVVTAAHCVTYSSLTEIVPLDEFILYFGKYYRNDTQDDDLVQIRQVLTIHTHPDFDPISFESDIALIRVSPKVKLTSRVQPVCLPHPKQSQVKGGQKGTVIGWGMMEDGSYSSFLQHAQVPIIENDQCQRDYRRLGVPIHVTENMICAGYQTGGQDSCSGDSGGPLVFPLSEDNNKWVLEGIVSWGSPFGCGNERQYGGYARVIRFVSWIEHFI